MKKDDHSFSPMLSPVRQSISDIFHTTNNHRNGARVIYFLIYLTIVILHLISYIVQADYRVTVANSTDVGCQHLVNKSGDSISTSILENDNAFKKLKYSKYFTSRPAFGLRIVDLICMILFTGDIVLRYYIFNCNLF